MTNVQTRPQKLLVGGVVIDILIVGVPLVAALFSFLFSVQSDSTVKLLIIIWFFSSILLFIIKAKHYMNAGRIATLAFLAGFLGWYTFPAVFGVFSADIAIGANLPYSIDNETVILAVIYLSLFLIGWIVASTFFLKYRMLRTARSIFFGKTNVDRVIVIGVAFCLAGFIPYLISGIEITEMVSLILKSRSVDKPWIHTANLGDSKSPFLFVAQSLMVGGVTILWLLTLDKGISNVKRIVIGVFALLITIIISLDQGTRGITALIIIPSIMSKIMEFWGKSRILFFTWLVGIITVIIGVFQLQLFYRTVWTSPDVAEDLLVKWITLGNTNDYFSETLYALEIVPAFHDYFRESVFYQFVVSPIPRFIWSSKPVSEVVGFYSLHRWGVHIYEGAGNVFPGIVGQYYMSWGVFGPVIVGIFMGWVTARTDGFLVRNKVMGDQYSNAIGFLLALWIFLSYRVLSPGLLYPLFFSCIIVLICKNDNRLSLLNGTICCYVNKKPIK